MEGTSNGPARGIHPSFPTADSCLLITNFIKKYPFEDFDHLDNSFYHHSQTDCSAHELAKKFLKQVRESGGYDVDCYPPQVLDSRLYPVQLDAVHEDEYKMLHGLAQCALQKINSETGCNYVFERLVKAVLTSCFPVLLTFTAKHVGNTQEHTFRAIVYNGLPHEEKEVLEWRAKPVDAAAAAASIDGWYMWSGHDFVLTDLYIWNGNDYVLASSPTP